jgi:hypothetical protein
MRPELFRSTGRRRNDGIKVFRRVGDGARLGTEEGVDVEGLHDVPVGKATPVLKGGYHL